MSIGLVQPLNFVLETAQPDQQSAGRQAPPGPNAKQTPQVFPPDAGNVSNPEGQPPSEAATVSQLQEDEVQLQRDSELKSELIVRYVTGSGTLILQVPGEQMLNLERAIAQEFEQENARPTTAAISAASNGGTSHGH